MTTKTLMKKYVIKGEEDQAGSTPKKWDRMLKSGQASSHRRKCWFKQPGKIRLNYNSLPC